MYTVTAIAIAAPPVAAAEIAPELPDSAWREYFLVLATGRAPYRPLYGEAEAAFVRSHDGVFREAGVYLDPESTREWMALQRVAVAAGPIAARGIADALDEAVTDTARWPLILALGSTGDTAIIPRIVAHATSPDRRVRTAVAIALGDLAHSDGANALMGRLTDTEAPVRRVAADGLRRVLERNRTLEFGLREAIAASLEAAAHDTDPWVRRNVTKAASAL